MLGKGGLLVALFVSAPRTGRRVEVGRLVGAPLDEFRDSWMRKHHLAVRANPRQLGIGEIRMDRAVADRVEGHRLAALLGLGHRVMMLDAATKRTQA